MTDGPSSFHNEVTLENGYYVVKMTYEDWTIDPGDRGEIFFQWKKDRPESVRSEREFIIIGIIAFLIIVTVTIILIIEKIKRKKGT